MKPLGSKGCCKTATVVPFDEMLGIGNTVGPSHCHFLKSCMLIRSCCAMSRYLQRRLARKRAQQRLFRESVIALNSLSNSACRVLRGESRSLSSSSASPLLPTGSQSSVLRRVRAKVISAGPLCVGLSEQEALVSFCVARICTHCSLSISRTMTSTNYGSPRVGSCRKTLLIW